MKTEKPAQDPKDLDNQLDANGNPLGDKLQLAFSGPDDGNTRSGPDDGNTESLTATALG